MSVETIRDIPVIVDHRKGFKDCPEMVDHDYTYSGFPFDRRARTDRDPLDDIAQRHPEIAQHLQGFNRRPQRPEDDQEFFRRFERPFGSGRFERFGFPFDSDDFEREPERSSQANPEQSQNQPQSPHNKQSTQPHSTQSPQYDQQFSPHYPTQPESAESQQPQPQSHTCQTQATQTDSDLSQEAEVEPKEEGQTTRGRPIQQSNTCDLGQKQPPDESVNDRSQRSMSAPPENKRFTSSVKIPMGGHQGQENGQGAKSQSSSGNSGSTERVIPIHVEGRDDPVLPKNFAASSHPPPQAERIFTDPPRPQPERIFGQRPEDFTRFVHREPRFGSDWNHPAFDARHGFPEDEFLKRSCSPTQFGAHKPQPQRQPQQAPPPQQQPKPQPQSQTEPQPQEPKPQVQKQPLGPIEQIQAIQKDVSQLLRQVEQFSGAPRDKHYLYLDEMLTRNLLKLDNVDTQGQDAIRSARKEAIRCIERAIGVLEAKAAANVAPKENKMEVEQPQSQPMEADAVEEAKEAMEVTSGDSGTVEEAKVEEKEDEASKSGQVEVPMEQAKVEEKEDVKGESAEKRVEEGEKGEDKPVENKQAGEDVKGENGVKTEGEEAKPAGEKKDKKKIKKKKDDKEKEKKQ